MTENEIKEQAEMEASSFCTNTFHHNVDIGVVCDSCKDIACVIEKHLREKETLRHIGNQRYDQVKTLESQLAEAKVELNCKDAKWIEETDQLKHHWSLKMDKLKAHNLQLVEALKRLKLEFDANVCECGEKWSETDGAVLVNESLSSPTSRKYLAMIEVVESADENFSGVLLPEEIPSHIKARIKHIQERLKMIYESEEA